MNSVRALQNIKELTDTKVLYVETNQIPQGIASSFSKLESKIPTESRPFIEFYRSQKELILLAPAKRSEKPELRNPIENQMAKVEF